MRLNGISNLLKPAINSDLGTSDGTSDGVEAWSVSLERFLIDDMFTIR